MVHQELSLCPHLRVDENILLGVEPTRLGIVRKKAMEERVRAVLAPMLGEGTRIEPEMLVGDLPPASRQLVEIARALAQESLRLLILDEPTSSLGKGDVERLFTVLRGLRERGLTILYVSHFLDEIEALTDGYTVLRDGKSVGAGRMAETAQSTIVEQMVGRQIEELFPRSARSPGEVLLEIGDLAGEHKPSAASLTLRRGEVLGIAGLIGAGRTELLRAVFGLDPVKRGTIKVGAHLGPATPAARWAEGVGFLSEDRKGEGLSTAMSIADNLTMTRLGDLGPWGFISSARQNAVTRRFIDTLSIRCQGPEQAIADLSGGNQQKVALGRLLYHDVDVLLLDEPTRGVDIGSKAQIYKLIDEQACAGKAVLLVSSYLPELFGICDRIAVMCRGTLGPARPVGETSERAVLREATGG
jgi:ribose transport system ATP-binding protein